MTELSNIDILQASTNFIWEKSQVLFDRLLELGPSIFFAILIVIIFHFVARFVHSLAERGLQQVTKNAVISALFASITRFLVLGIGFFFALEILSLGKVVTSLLAGAGIIGLAMGIAFQDFVSNIISGIYLAIKKPLHVGDVVDTAGQFGTIVKLDLRSTIMETNDGKRVYIPNREVFQNPIINYSQKKKHRVEIEVGIQYGEDLDRVESIVRKALANLSTKMEGEELDFFYIGFEDSSINFVTRFWIRYSRVIDEMKARHEAIVAINKAFEKENIVIPFPIRTLDINPQQLKEIGLGKK